VPVANLQEVEQAFLKDKAAQGSDSQQSWISTIIHAEGLHVAKDDSASSSPGLLRLELGPL
jgi:hypothetical protein